MKYHKFLGIDPGASGGLAVVRRDGGVIAEPLVGYTVQELWEIVSSPSVCGDFAVIEAVNRGFPGTSKANMAALYGSFRELRAFLVAVGVPFAEVSSSKWQRVLGISSKESVGGYAGHKKRLRQIAQSLFPGEKVTRGTADALLIAEYARRTYG